MMTLKCLFWIQRSTSSCSISITLEAPFLFTNVTHLQNLVLTCKEMRMHKVVIGLLPSHNKLFEAPTIVVTRINIIVFSSIFRGFQPVSE